MFVCGGGCVVGVGGVWQPNGALISAGPGRVTLSPYTTIGDPWYLFPPSGVHTPQRGVGGLCGGGGGGVGGGGGRGLFKDVVSP